MVITGQKFPHANTPLHCVCMGIRVCSIRVKEGLELEFIFDCVI